MSLIPDSPIVAQEDEIHSKEEPRYYVLGRKDGGRHLFIVFTLRKKRIGVISARDMSRKERRVYREQIEKGPEIQE
ncbi:MAG: BrnT family toxin [Syntrophaceae bacterium]|nr:BrnT family toxin [Syntrophaceae bacterium]